MIQKVADKNIVSLNFGIFIVKTIVGLILEIVKINKDNMRIKINLIEQDTIGLL